MYSDRLNSPSSVLPRPSGSNSQAERDPEPLFAIVIARHVLTDTQRQRVILLDAARPSRIVSRFCSYVQGFIYNDRLSHLKTISSANNIVVRRFVDINSGFCEIFFMCKEYKDEDTQKTIEAMNTQLGNSASLMHQEGIIFAPWPVPGPIPAYDGSPYNPRGIVDEISLVPARPTPASLFLSNDKITSAPSPPPPGPQISSRMSDVNFTAPPPRLSYQTSRLPPPPPDLPARPSWGPLSAQQASRKLTRTNTKTPARPSTQTPAHPPRQDTAQILPALPASFSSQPNSLPIPSASSSSATRSTAQTANRPRAEFALIHAKNLINSQQLDDYKKYNHEQKRFWTYIGQFAPKFFEDFKGPKVLVSEISIHSRLIQINPKSYREIFFVCCKREPTQRTGSQSPINELKELLLAVREDMCKMGKLLLSGPENVPPQGRLYDPDTKTMHGIRAVSAVAILPHLLPASSTLAAAHSRVSAASSSTADPPSFAPLPALPLPHANNSSTQPSGSYPFTRIPNTPRNSGVVSTQPPKPPVEIIELSDSDDDEVVILPNPPPAPMPPRRTAPEVPPTAPPSAPPRVRLRGPLWEEPINIDALETEVIDLTDDSPARRTVALFEELPLSTEPVVPQVEPNQASPPSPTVSVEEPPPSSPEPETMEVDVDSTPVVLTSAGAPQDVEDDPLRPSGESFSPSLRVERPPLLPREGTPLLNTTNPKSSFQPRGFTPPVLDVNEDQFSFFQQESSGEDNDPLDFLTAVRTVAQQRSDTPDYMSDVDMGLSSSNGSPRNTLELRVNVANFASESGLKTPLSAASSDTEGVDEKIEDFDANCSEWAREMASKMEPRLAIRYLRKAAECRKDPLDSSFSDMMRAQPTEYRLAHHTRRIFESWMIKNSMNEPEAPPIDVKNTVDDTPCPSWDFTYTNLLIRGDGVPKPPKPTDLEGCNCVGGCRSDVHVCSCAQRNMEFAEARSTTGFLYDSQGCLQEFAFPIFECNEACSCAEYCNNRVAQRGRTRVLEIRKTEKKGWGVFAAEDIPKGTYLGVYSGELLRDEEAEVRGKVYNESQDTYLFDIDFWYLKLYLKKKGRKFKKGEFCVDAMHAGCFTRFLNHSCDPNSVIVPCVFGEAYPEIPYLAFFTIDPIAKDQEITFSYQGGTITDDRERNAARLRADAKRRLGKKKTVKPGARTFGRIDKPCACGTVLCRGSMWNQESDEDEEDDELDSSDASDSA